MGYRLKPEPEDSGTTKLSLSEPALPGDQSLREQQILRAVAEARESFKGQLCDRLSTLQQAVAALDTVPFDSERYEQAIHAAHRFAGALGTFGFAAAFQLAEAIEDCLQIQPLNTRQVQQVRQLVEQLSQELRRDSEPGAIAALASCPQLLVISRDQQWIQSLLQATGNQLISMKLVSADEGNEWGEQLLEQLQSEYPGAVLLDLDHFSASKALTLLTDLTKRLTAPVLVITERDSFDDRLEVARRGGYKFLLKAMPTDQVLEQVFLAFKSRHLEGLRILMVGSDRQTLDPLCDILESCGSSLKFLTDPQQFWQTLVNFIPNLLILDVEMSGLSGLDFYRVVKADPGWSKLPILFLTSHEDIETVQELLAIGADDCIPRSIAGPQLLTRILNRRMGV